jgi:kinetochore protein Mis13/DSN1
VALSRSKLHSFIHLSRYQTPFSRPTPAHRAKAEENAWLEVANFYNSYRTNVLAELDKQLPPSTSAKAKGKQRATSQEVEEWSSPREYELPEVFRGEGGVGLARSVIADASGEEGRKSPLSERLEGLEFKVGAYFCAFCFHCVYRVDTDLGF